MRWRAGTIVQLHRARRARRPQVKRGPLGSCTLRMVSSLVRVALAGVLVNAACARHAVPSVAPTDCSFAVASDATRFDADSLRALAGEYNLIQVAWQPAPPTVTRGRLHLEVPDSQWREVPCGFRRVRRDLIGWYRPADPSPNQWHAIISSHDPAHPGAVVQGSVLRIGMHCVLDGGGDNFTITAVSARGFWGYWETDMGIAVVMDTATHRILPDATGFFCALREESR